MHGLVALMEIQASRSRARIGTPAASRSCCWTRTAPCGTSCSFAAAWRRWQRAERSAAREARTRCRRRLPRAMRGRARRTRPTGRRIAALYDELARLAPSPVVELNRAVAVSMAYGPAAGLELVDALATEPALARLPPAAERARRSAAELGRLAEARVEFERAASLTRNARERALLLERARSCAR